MANVLIIDDDVQLCDALSMVVTKMGHEAQSAYTLKRGLSMVDKGEFEVVILDIRLPDGNGLDALPRIKDSKSAPEVIILSGSCDPDGAELAIRSGAWSYIPKPPTMNKIQLPVQRAIDYHQKKRAHRPPVVLKRHGIVGESQAIMACLDTVALAASTDSNVLITGDTGTGKEIFARAIHENSARSDGPFIIVDCAALPENLVESILFGHEKGAFTSADKRSQGVVRQAHNGTLFLDEIGELPMSMQKAFLRVLQDRRFRPVGGVEEVESNFRLVAATNKDLEELVLVWKFRQDLLFRLRTITIDLPSLKDRGRDITIMANSFTESLCKRMKIARKGLTPEFLDALNEYEWPGNVREFLHALESSLAMAGDEAYLSPRHLPVNIRAQMARDSLTSRTLAEAPHPSPDLPDPGHGLDPGSFPTLKDYRAQAMADLEKEYLQRLVSMTEWDIKKACSLSGLSRARLYALLKLHRISRAGSALAEEV
ncbi:MAG: sigma-54-dependent Fis family transcriptional regulator [Desulfovibrio sp.]|nr:MAG: sigma-54-dependent Fis family transcriptional regulator [Desulfovibrio sp.]